MPERVPQAKILSWNDLQKCDQTNNSQSSIKRFYNFCLLRNYRNITDLKGLTLRFYDFNFSRDYGNTSTKFWIDTIIFCIYILK